ncbi:MAG: formylglycine-generating enzyme family protein, partial [Nannocystaceae bacterium]
MTVTNRCRAFVGFSLLMHVFGCEAASDRHGFVDQPEPVPAGEFAGEDVLERNEPKVEPVDPSECGPRSGKMPDGTCIRLRVRETPHVQQVQIPAGTFVMGRIPDDYNAEVTREQPSVRWSGQPPRPVAVASFWIDLHEVSRGAYGECVEKGACTQVACPAGVNDPVAEQSSELAAVFPQTCVTHAQAEQYCRAQGHRLPTEAEWEYAARGVDARRFPWGNEALERLPDGLYPVGRVRSDQSYFGILGMGTDAIEWVAERYDPEAALRPFLKRDFRLPNGPTGAARATFERQAHCGESPAPGCTPPELERHVIKSTVVGARRGVRAIDPPQLGSHELEGWPTARVRDQLGFRCASEVVPTEEEPILQVPERAPVVPIFRSTGTFQVFGGIAEAVSLAEAKAFCEALFVPLSTGNLEGWRLPSVSEV